MYPIIKEPTHRYTLIGTSVEKIAMEVIKVINTYHTDLRRQQRNLPRIINPSREFFDELLPYITYEAIHLIYIELLQAKKWLSEVKKRVCQPPAENTCERRCDLPYQYGLPCKYWLYRCTWTGEVIPLSLVHPRWLQKPPEVVVGWKMSFKSGVTAKQYMNMTGPEVISINSGNDDLPGPSYPVPTPAPSNRYRRRGQDLIEQSNFQAHEFHSKIKDSYRAKEYSREYEKYVKNLNREYLRKYNSTTPLPTSFTSVKKTDDQLIYQKGKSKRRRAMTGREAANQAEIEARRQKRKEELEKEKTDK